MSEIKIAHVLHSVGGVDVSLRLLLQNIDKTKYKNIVIHGEKDTFEKFVDSNGDFVESYRTSIFRDINIYNDIKSIVSVYRLLKKIKPDIIHAHSAKGGVVGRIVGFALGIKVFYTPQAFSYLSAESNFKRKIYLLIEKLLSNNNNYVLASSASERDRAINEVGYKPENVLLFNNCINKIFITSGLNIMKTWPDEYICTVGRPSYQKNIELMVQVMYELKKHQKMHLVVMGVGHHVGHLLPVKKMISELGMESDITLLEWTDRSDVLNIIKDSKLYLSTARYEGLPYSVIESLALSKPCVVSNCDGNKDLIVDNYNGFVVTDNDPVTYKDKILSILNDSETQIRMSERSYEVFLNNFDISKEIKNLENSYFNYSRMNTKKD